MNHSESVIRDAITKHYPMAGSFATAAIAINEYLRIVFFSPASTGIFGYNQDRVIGSEVSILKLPITDDDLEHYLKEIILAENELGMAMPLNGGEPFEISTKNGSKTIAAFLYPLKIEDIWYIVFFLQVFSEVDRGNLLLMKSDNLWVQKAQGLAYLYKVSPGAAAFFAVLFLLWLATTNLASIVPLIPKAVAPSAQPTKSMPDGTIVDVDKEGNKTIRFGR